MGGGWDNRFLARGIKLMRTDCYVLLRSLRLSDSESLTFACQCVRAVWAWVDVAELRTAVEVAERVAVGQAEANELLPTVPAGDRLLPQPRREAERLSDPISPTRVVGHGSNYSAAEVRHSQIQAFSIMSGKRLGNSCGLRPTGLGL